MGFLISISLFISLIFPIVLSLFGLEWVGSDESPLYTYSVIGINSIILAYIAFYELFNWPKAKGAFYPYLIPLVVLVLFFIEEAFFYRLDKQSSISSLIYFFAFGLVGIYAATFCYRYNKLAVVIKNFELLMFICSLALIIALPNLAANTVTRVTIGGGNHQAISYSAALAFGVIYCSLNRATNYDRYRLFKLKIYPIIACVIMCLLAVTCLIGGGRGGAVLLIVNFILCTWVVARKNIGAILLCILVGIAALYFLSTISLGGLGDLLERGFERCFAFIDDNSIDLTKGSSGRDRVYEDAIELILSRPLFGYGFFSQYDICRSVIHQPYSHNIFFESMLQFGIFGLIAMVTVLSITAKKLINLISKGSYYIFLLPMATYPLIMLQFSGTYLFTPSFWFIVIVTCGYYLKSLQLVK